MTKPEINETLHKEIMNQVTAVPDYLVSKNTIAPCITEVEKMGWELSGWTKREDLDKERLSDWSKAGIIQLKRTYVITITRSKEHQALVETTGEVKKGENTYQRAITEIVQATIKARFSESKTDLVDNIIESCGIALTNPMIQRTKQIDQIQVSS